MFPTNVPHVCQCGPGLCTRNKTDCKKFLTVEIIIKKEKLTEFLLPLNPFFENNEKRLKENFRTF